MRHIIIVILFVISQVGWSQKIQQPNLPGNLLVDVGLNVWDQNNEPVVQGATPAFDQNVWGSKSVGIYYQKRFRISDSFGFYPAVGLTIDKFDFGDSLIYTTSPDEGTQLSTLTPENIVKNRIVATYFEVPVEFRFHPFKTNDGEGFFISFGGIAGLRMGTHTKVSYSIESTRYTEKLKGNLGLDDFRVAAQTRIGWQNLHLFYKQYFTEVFRKDPLPDFNPTPWTIGINVSGF